MSDFLAQVGYMSVWAFGIPKYSLEQAYEEYFKMGLTLFIIFCISTAYLTITLIVYIIKKRKEKLDNDN